jgi:magnesium transporter
MAEEVDIVQPAAVSMLDRLPMRNEEGEIRQEFVAEITRAMRPSSAT